MPLTTELTLQDYWRIVRRRKGVLAGVWATVVGTSLFFTQIQEPVYEASATIKIEQGASVPGLAINGSWDVWTKTNTEARSLRSTAVLERAYRLLHPESSQEDASHILTAVQALQSRVKTEQVGDSSMLRVSIRSPNGVEAAAWANAVVQAYILKGIDDRTSRLRETKVFTQQEMEKARQRLREAEDALKTHSKQAGARGYNVQLTAQWTSLKTRLDELKEMYTDQHPDVVDARTRLESIERQLEQMPENETSYLRLAREVRINEELYTLLAKKHKEVQIAEAEKEQAAFVDSPALPPKRPVSPNKAANAAVGVVAGFILGLAAVLVVESMDASIGTIEDVESFIALPVLAVIPHLHVKGADKRPLLKRWSQHGSVDVMQKRLVVHQPAHSSFAEAHSTLRTNLHLDLRRNVRPGHVVAFTSASVAEGKTLTSANFSLTAAEAGFKTLFIEADLRLPTAHRLLGLPRNPGLVDAAMSGRSLAEVTRTTADFLLAHGNFERFARSPGIENFRFVSAGPPTPGPSDLLGSDVFRMLMDQARAEYDLIVIDCAPVLLFADALVVSPLADGVVIVYKAGRTARGSLRRARDQLLHVGTKIYGVVLNDLRAHEADIDYGYYAYEKRPESGGSSS